MARGYTRGPMDSWIEGIEARREGELFGEERLVEAVLDAFPTPVEAALAFAIAKTRRAGGSKPGGFPGAETVLRQLADGPSRRLVGLVSYEPVPVRPPAKIVDDDGREVGEVTSGTVSPTLGRPVMLAYLATRALRGQPDERFHALVRDRRIPVHLTPLPFVPKRYKR